MVNSNRNLDELGTSNVLPLMNDEDRDDLINGGEVQPRILIVDDEPETILEMSELLTDEDFICDTACGPEEAIKIVADTPNIAIIVTDLKMPNMDGLEMVRAITDSLPAEREVAVIVVTGQAGAPEAIEALRTGALDFIKKPVSPDQLIHAVERAVERVQLRALRRRFNTRLEEMVLERTSHIQNLTSDILESNKKLLHINDELESANRVKSEFLSMISHELRTPLNAIIGFSEIMATEANGTGQEKKVNFNERVAAAGKKLLGIINTILDLVDINTGDLTLDKTVTDATSLVKEVVDEYCPKIGAKSLNLTFTGRKQPLWIRCDETRFRQAIGNILDNAIQFTPPGDPIGVAVEEMDGNAVITILDTGKGMTKEEIQLASEPFRQVDGTTTKSHYGIGMGLTLSRLVFELHGGTLEVESARDEGTTVTARIPATEASHD